MNTKENSVLHYFYSYASQRIEKLRAEGKLQPRRSPSEVDCHYHNQASGIPGNSDQHGNH